MLTADEALEQRITDEGARIKEHNRLPNCLDGLYCDYNNEKVIYLRPSMDAPRRLCTLAEEYGHMITSWGDARTMNPSEMTRQEARAIAYAIELVVPLERLYKAKAAGVRNRFECAEYLGVTEEFLSWVFAYYKARISDFERFFLEKD